MRLVIELSTVYALYALGVSLLIWRFGMKDRGPSIVVAWVIPFLLIASFVELPFVVLFGAPRQLLPCPDGLDEAELLVERHRQQMFGGEPQKPHFATDWAALYQKTLEQEAERVQKFARRVLTFA